MPRLFLLPESGLLKEALDLEERWITKMDDMLKQWIAENDLKPLDAEEEKRLAFSVMTYKRLLNKLEWYHWRNFTEIL